MQQEMILSSTGKTEFTIVYRANPKIMVTINIGKELTGWSAQP